MKRISKDMDKFRRCLHTSDEWKSPMGQENNIKKDLEKEHLLYNNTRKAAGRVITFNKIWWKPKLFIKFFFFFFFFFFVVGASFCFNQGLSHSIFFSDVLEIYPAGILSLEILTNLSASILVTCSSHSLLLYIHLLWGWILFFLVFSSHFCYVSALVSSAYMILFPFSYIFVSPDKIIQTAGRSCCF